MEPDATGSPGRRRPSLGLALAACAYLALRGLILYTAFDEVGLWMYEIHPMGTIAELTLRGIRVPAYLFYDNAAGQVLGGYLAVPAFLLLGPTYLALKLVPLLMGLATLFLVHAILRDAFGRTAGLLGAWLVALGPTTMVKYSMVCSGNHFENVFFVSVVLWLFYRLHGGEITARGLFLLALAAGFAVFVFLGAVIPVGVLAAMHLGIRGWRRTAGDLAALAGGFVLGLSPLLLLNAWTGGRGVFYLAAKFGETDSVGSSSLARVPARIATYVGQKLPASAAFPSFAGIDGSVLDKVFAAAIVAAFLAGLPSALRGIGALLGGLVRGGDRGAERERFERAKLVPMLLYLPLSALAFGASNLVVYDLGGNPLAFSAYRYFLPVFLFGILCLAAVAARGLERSGLARTAAGALFAAALLPGLSNFAVVDWRFSSTGVGARYDGYDLSKVARVLLSTRNQLTFEQIRAFLDSFPPLLRARVARSIGYNLAVRQVIDARGKGAAGVREGRIDLEGLVAAYDPRDRAELARGAGIAARFLQVSTSARLEDLLGLVVRTCEGTPGSVQALLPAFLEGVAMTNPTLPLVTRARGILGETGALIRDASAGGFPREIAEGLARGDGLLCGGLLRRGIPEDAASVAAVGAGLPIELRPSFYRGLGAGCAEGGEAPDLPARLEVPDIERTEFWAGFAGMLRAIHGASARELASRVGAGWSAEDRASLEAALGGP
jgi:hypothetical protein